MGIHIRKDSGTNLSSLFFNKCPNLINKNVESVTSAFFYFLIHGLFHHIVENAASKIELIIGNPHIYGTYSKRIYSDYHNNNKHIEETLCNSYLYKWSSLFHIDNGLVRRLLLQQSPDYDNFVDFVNTSFVEGVRLLVSLIQFGTHMSATVFPIENLIDNSEIIGYLCMHAIPIWLHDKPKPLFGNLKV